LVGKLLERYDDAHATILWLPAAGAGSMMAQRGTGTLVPQRAALPQRRAPERENVARDRERRRGMIEIIRTNDLVVLGFVQSLLEGAAIPVFVADAHISVLEGSIGAFPRRLLVPADHVAQARRLVAEAGLAAELRHA